MINGWNMHSVVELAPSGAVLAPEGSQPRADFMGAVEDVLIKALSFHIVMRELNELNGRGAMAKRSQELDNQLARQGMEYALAKGELLPGWDEIENNPSYLEMLHTTRAVIETPKAKLENLRKLADTLGFILVPFAALDERSYENESSDMKGAIHGFDRKLSPWFDVYALAPAGHYSLDRHISSGTELDLRAPKGFDQAFLALSMIVPVLRDIKSDVNKLKSKVGQMQVQLDRLEKRLEQERLERIREVAEANRRSFQFRDPMLFALPKGNDLESDGAAIIGPCWGPDLENMLLAAFHFKADTAQRKLIESKVAAFLT